MDDNSLQFDVLAAMLRSDTKEQAQLLEHLATMLEGALPDHCSVKRSGGLLGPRKVDEVTIVFDKLQYVMKRHGSRVAAQEQQLVRGVVLKTSDVEVEDWINKLAVELTKLAEKSSKAKQALSELLLR